MFKSSFEKQVNASNEELARKNRSYSFLEDEDDEDDVKRNFSSISSKEVEKEASHVELLAPLREKQEREKNLALRKQDRKQLRKRPSEVEEEGRNSDDEIGRDFSSGSSPNRKKGKRSGSVEGGKYSGKGKDDWLDDEDEDEAHIAKELQRVQDLKDRDDFSKRLRERDELKRKSVSIRFLPFSTQ